MPEEQIRRTEQSTAAFVLSMLAGLWMMAGGGMMGGMMSGFGWAVRAAGCGVVPASGNRDVVAMV